MQRAIDSFQHSPYLRAMVAFLRGKKKCMRFSKHLFIAVCLDNNNEEFNFDEIVANRQLALVDRIAFATIHLSDDELHTWLQRWIDEGVKARLHKHSLL